MKKPLRIFVVLTVCFLAACTSRQGGVTVVERPDRTQTNVNYPINRPPLQPAAFIKLPLGAVQPEGWTRELLVRQADGLCGHLGEISAWLDKENNEWLGTGKKELRAGAPRWMDAWEEFPYWIRGYSDMAFMLDDEAMKVEAMIWLNAIFECQEPDGWFGPYKKTADGRREHWPNMLILFTMQHYYECTGDPRVIPFMERYFGYEMSVPDEDFLRHSGWETLRAGDNLSSVYWLYNLTGEAWLIELAEKIHRNTSNWKWDTNLPTWHNVNIAQGFRDPGIYYLLSKDSSDLKALYNNFSLVRRTFGQVPGGMFGGDEVCRLGYIDPRQGTETCGFAEQMTSDGMLTGITGDVFWADNCEDILFNSFPAAFTPDMRALRYLSSPNMVLNDAEDHAPGVNNGGPFLLMSPLSFRCCQHNHGHAIPYYIQNMVMASNDNGLAANLYGPCVTRAKVADGVEVTLTEQTYYPFEESVRFVLGTPREVSFPLYLRVPQWCRRAAVRINGSEARLDAGPGGYFRIDRTWKDGDRVELLLPMELNVRQWETNQNSVSVNYGPLTFSLLIEEEYIPIGSKEPIMSDSRYQATVDEKEWPAFEIHPRSPWNYGLVLDPEHPESSLRVEKRGFPDSNYPFLSADAPIVLKARGKKIPSWQIDQYGLCGVLPVSPVASAEPEEELTLVPMGGARLRISAFPTVL